MDFSNLTPQTDTHKETKQVNSAEVEAKLSELPEVLPMRSLKTRVVDSINIEPDHQVFAKQEADAFHILDTNSVMTFAFKPQKEYTESLKILLGDSKVRDIGAGAEILEQIKTGLDIADVKKMREELKSEDDKKSFLKFSLRKKKDTAFSNWETKKFKLQNLVSGVEATIQSQIDSLVKENARLDVLLQEVRTNFYQLGIYLYAGELIVERGAKEYEELRAKTVESGDALLVSDLMVLKGQMQAFDSRLLEIKKAYVSAPVEMQNILMIQQAARIEMQTQMNSLLFTVPKLIKSLIRLVSLYNIKNAQTVRDQHNELNAQLDALAGDTLADVATNAQQALIDAAAEADKIELQAAETMNLAKKLSEGGKQIKIAQEKADLTLGKVMTDFQQALADSYNEEVLGHQPQERIK